MGTHEVKQERRSARPLRIYRVAQSLSQREAAAAAGVDRATIIRLEAGHKPSAKTANALAYALGVDVAALFPEITEAPR